MRCPHCFNEIPQGSAFCLHCGNSIVARATQPQPKMSAGAAVVIVFTLLGISVIVFLLLVGGVAWFGAHRSDSTAQSPLGLPSIISSEHQIVNDSFAVGARQYVYYKFTAPSPAHVTGSFTAQGGRNDIQAALFTESGFINFQNGHAGQVYYQTPGYVTTDNIDLHLPAGTYYLVFSNTAALLTNKVVRANVVATY
jgi:hypothetical protein